MKNRYVLMLALLAAFSPRAFAHTVWFEPLDAAMVIRFAEPGTRFEKSPGHLDSLSAPQVFMLVTNAPALIDTPKKKDHFLATGASSNNVLCTESVFTVRGGRKPFFYARWQPKGNGAGTALLTLDLVPTEKDGEVRVFFRGKPLPSVKATLRTPDEEETEIVADEQGYLRFKLTQSGLHLLAVAHHRESESGFWNGQEFQQTSHNAALSWVQ